MNDDSSQSLFIANIYSIILAYLILLIVYQYVRNRGVPKQIMYLFALLLSFAFAVRETTFGDTITYLEYFDIIDNDLIIYSGSPFFYSLMYVVRLFPFSVFLFVVSFVYIVGGCYALIRLFKDYAGIAFAVFLISPYFTTYGYNTIRNGMAASLFLIALSYVKQKRLMYLFMLLSCATHLSMVATCLFFFLTRRFKKYSYYIGFWIVSVVLVPLGIGITSIISYMVSFSNSSGMTPDNSSYYNDFILYGLPVVLLGMLCHKRMDNSDKCTFYMYLIGSSLQIQSIPYNVLSLRFAYYAGMLLPVILPIIIQSYPIKNLKLITLLLLVIFIVKAQKIFFMA